MKKMKLIPELFFPILVGLCPVVFLKPYVNAETVKFWQGSTESLDATELRIIFERTAFLKFAFSQIVNRRLQEARDKLFEIYQEFLEGKSTLELQLKYSEVLLNLRSQGYLATIPELESLMKPLEILEARPLPKSIEDYRNTLAKTLAQIEDAEIQIVLKGSGKAWAPGEFQVFKKLVKDVDAALKASPNVKLHFRLPPGFTFDAILGTFYLNHLEVVADQVQKILAVDPRSQATWDPSDRIRPADYDIYLHPQASEPVKVIKPKKELALQVLIFSAKLSPVGVVPLVMGHEMESLIKGALDKRMTLADASKVKAGIRFFELLNEHLAVQIRDRSDKPVEFALRDAKAHATNGEIPFGQLFLNSALALYHNGSAIAVMSCRSLKN